MGTGLTLREFVMPTQWERELIPFSNAVPPVYTQVTVASFFHHSEARSLTPF
jgi:hypothetical protein